MISPLLNRCDISVLDRHFLMAVPGYRLERKLYNARDAKAASRGWFWSRKRGNANDLQKPPEGIAISIRNLKKTFKAPWWKWGKQEVTAVADLSIDIPKHGIYVLLGSNG